MSGDVEFILPDGAIQKTGFCEHNLNLLAHAQAIELDLGSECGGHGICGKDRIRIEAGADSLSPQTEAEREHLSPEELRAGWRLGCQCFPESDELRLRALTSSRAPS
jgi:ferredoxin